eukprot:9957838-Heterocapsa_arctica.AAC.1
MEVGIVKEGAANPRSQPRRLRERGLLTGSSGTEIPVGSKEWPGSSATLRTSRTGNKSGLTGSACISE